MSPMITSDGHELVVGLLAGGADDQETPRDGGRLLRLESLRISDVITARDEAWWTGFCSGALPGPLLDHDWQLEPGESTGKDRVKGYFLSLRQGRRTYRKHFATRTLQAVARRAALQLRDQEILGAEEEYSFFLSTRPAEQREKAQDQNAITSRRVTDPPVIESESLADWLARSRMFIGPVGTELPCPEDKLPQEIMPVFIGRDLWDEARELSRRGGENESAAVLVGYLARDTRSPAVFLVITECLQAEHAEEAQFSVAFSGETWGELRARVEQRRRKLKRPAEMIVGTAHGHNFKPTADSTGRMTCDACPVLEICSRSTCHASRDDEQFHQSVFTEAPWAQLLLWGWNARNEEEWRLYGLKDAALSPRSVRIVDE